MALAAAGPRQCERLEPPVMLLNINELQKHTAIYDYNAFNIFIKKEYINNNSYVNVCKWVFCVANLLYYIVIMVLGDK